LGRRALLLRQRRRVTEEIRQLADRAPRHLIIGNPENRRVKLFCSALTARRHPEPIVVAHNDLLQQPQLLAELDDQPPLVVRIDATGEHAGVERQLLGLGYPAAMAQGVSAIEPQKLARIKPLPGRILPPRQLHLGFERYIRRIECQLEQRPSWTALTPPPAIRELFDKRITSRRYARHQIPTPPRLDSVESPEQLRQAMAERRWSMVFVKLSCGSSASCLAVYRLGDNGRSRLMTTIRRTPKGWFNSLRVQRIDRQSAIDEVLSFLISEGSQIERAMPKPRFNGAFTDLRVLVVAGEPAFMVLRQSHHPITNLHLGGWRGDLDAFIAQLPPGALDRALDSCRRVARLHGCYQLGIDIMLSADLEQHYVLEANAFGDLLPGLDRDGLDVFEWQVEHLSSWLNRQSPVS
jgi:hypothetical protein